MLSTRIYKYQRDWISQSRELAFNQKLFTFAKTLHFFQGNFIPLTFLSGPDVTANCLETKLSRLYTISAFIMATYKFTVGCRIKDSEGFRATVRYVGPVAAAKNADNDWLGVEWDNITRGKHDGSCVDNDGNYHRYFECVNGAVCIL